MDFYKLKPGDEVTRHFGEDGPAMTLKVTSVDVEKRIIECGPWKFNMDSGGEIDEDLGWDGYNTGTFLTTR